MHREGRAAASSSARSSSGESADSLALALAEYGINAGLAEEICLRFRVDPESVHPAWSESAWSESAWSESAWAKSFPANGHDGSKLLGPDRRTAEQRARVLRLIHAYRTRGHRIARTDPLAAESNYFPELDPAHYGLGHDDLDRRFIAGDLPGGPVQSLREILARLRATYCGSVSVEFTHIQDPGPRVWIQQRMESSCNTTTFECGAQLRILERLVAAQLFERFLHTRFVGQKRFSLEGAESLIPLLDSIVEGAPGHEIGEIVLGMAHRGRLNVLCNVLGKSLESIFSEFEDVEHVDSPFGSGDVKYHKGFSNDRLTRSGALVHLSLTANPSHLEAVDPVVEGRAKAKQVQAGDREGKRILPLLIHGDAAFAGQGIVAETLNLSRLEGYCTGRTIHVVVNNQIGFTTTPNEARSTLYATDVAKMIQVPVFHVNGEDPEAVIHCGELALAYRQRFASDVVIDMQCYRRHGHNEGDEPDFTQPLLYEKIRRKSSVRKLYTERLLETRLLDEEHAKAIEAELAADLDNAVRQIDSQPPGPDEPYEPSGPWAGYARTRPGDEPETRVPIERLAGIAEGLARVPDDFEVHPKLRRMLEARRKALSEGRRIDWGLGEALAFGSLLVEGTPVRISGQDSSRGTFSHRHASLVDQKTAREFVPLDHLSTTQAPFEVYDSLLSEAAVLGFEYGYSLADPTTLTIWEAQFGDFANGAQVIIDQFLCSAHAKWQRMSGLVLLLPHGYEGQGPEHSSARVERFLQLCAEENIQVVNCTNPAQLFHVLRRQMRRRFRSPLILLTPKSLLRSAKATSHPDEFSSGGFQRIIDDPIASRTPERVSRVLLCSGKVYYDLVDGREERMKPVEVGTVAIARVEQLYPWPDFELSALLGRYANAERVIWCQEEPSNAGPWSFVLGRIPDALRPTQKLSYAGRSERASPATGSGRIHRAEQAEVVAAAFSGCTR